MSEDIQVLHAEIVPGSLQSNLMALSEQCEAMAAEYAGIREIRDYDEYRQAKRDRAALNRAVKQVEDERKRVKREYLKPLDAFESMVKSTIEPLTDVQEKQAKLVKDYEDAARAAKRERLETYWEQTYPVLALCTGEASEPLVPFKRVFDPDWTRRVSELGSDMKAQEDMDALAGRLAEGERMIADAFEGDQCLIDAATMTMYGTLDPVHAVTKTREEQRRRADMQRIREARETAATDGMLEGDADYSVVANDGTLLVSAHHHDLMPESETLLWRVWLAVPDGEEHERLKRVLFVTGFEYYHEEEVWA